MKIQLKAIILAAVLVLGLLPVQAMAATSYDATDWSSFKSAVNSAATDGTQVTIVLRKKVCSVILLHK